MFLERGAVSFTGLQRFFSGFEHLLVARRACTVRNAADVQLRELNFSFDEIFQERALLIGSPVALQTAPPKGSVQNRVFLGLSVSREPPSRCV